MTAPKRIFIDGEAGTTGLQIRERLDGRADVALVSISADDRKNPAAKAGIFENVDLVVLCLPDDAAKESVALADTLGDKAPKILDASTAHRVAPGWTYGFPELCAGQADAIKAASRVGNPGCYATGAIAMLRPLVDAGLVAVDATCAIHAVSGYSGGGKAMIAAYEAGQAAPFELYALGLEHKHIPEIMAYGRLAARPLFVPSVGNFRQGMLVSLPLALESLPGKPTAADLEAALQSHYAGAKYVRVMAPEPGGKLEPQALNNTNDLEIRVYANEAHRQAVVVAKLDNLGKGASGAAVQNLELMLGL
ncbi:N-acetyl-gamma-glutamyl-phosphate reductase [Rhodoblastus acidophilus]|uniref:N-acetyl-gamma-glutamyl-phosphate reductase n=1 Tax=Rhodoblastus acidophilus TaxID=1074 RepID=A0A6N8DKL7_RHOAC|nr:N-acetyl-gamma-glutamyl-phosphate reductase [Rhodoblastus acidophilus]MCW2273866.1 N-acetyl-gamma-glutamyl-phosphate reductase [Rhodoblastus acidophilus]MTV30989.1 N-acetyl-gamma-glutamyl-phosphate reductase [Rhodoblastus acidophilus]